MRKKNTTRSTGGRRETRRDFIKKSALGAAAVMAGCSPKVAEEVSTTAEPKPAAPAPGAVLGANDRLVVGFIGVGGQGYSAHLRTVVNRNNDGEPWHEYAYNAIGAAACDLYSVRRDRARTTLEEARDAQGMSGYQITAHADYREVLDNPDIDAVFIGTVDHWHTRIALDALDAGKHVYCEKPMTRYMMEGFAIHDAVKRTGKTFQIGSQYCTEGKWHKAAEMIRAGKIGRLVLAQDSYMRNNPDGEWNYQLEDEVTPQTLDWQTWLGPVDTRSEFSREHFHRWRKYYQYCAGILGDLLAHRIHPLLIATGNPEFPTRVVCIGNKKIGDATVGPEDRSVDDNTQLLAEFPSGLCMLITGSTVNEVGLPQVIRGQEATLYFSGNTVELRPERPFADLVDQETVENVEPGVSVPAHVNDFFAAIRENRPPNGNIDIAIRAQTIISMAEMSNRLGQMVFFDEATRKLTNGAGVEIEPITYGTLPLS